MAENAEKKLSSSSNHNRPYKIVSSLNDLLTLNELNLQKVLNHCIDGLGTPELRELPVAIISIIGPPSCGKSFLTNLVINYYNSEEDDGGWLEKLTKKSKDGTHPKLTGFTWHSVTDPPAGIFKPSDEEISTSGVYMWPQLFTRKSIELDKSILVLILHLCLGRDKTDDDLQTLERFLIMASSRMAEIDYGNNDFRILNEVSVIQSANSKLPVSCLKEQHCDSILYIFISNVASSSSKTSTDEEAKNELLRIGQDPSVLNSFQHVNLARIKHIKGTLEESFLKIEKNMTRSLKRIAEQIADEFEVAPKKLIEKGAMNYLHLKDITNFFKATVDEVNLISSQFNPKKREAVDYSKTYQPLESSTPLLPLPEDSASNTALDVEKLQPLLDSSCTTKPDMNQPPNDNFEKCLIRSAKPNVCNFTSATTSPHQIQIEEVDNVIDELEHVHEQIIIPTKEVVPITSGLSIQDPDNNETSLKLNENVSQETLNEMVNIERQQHLSATLPTEIVEKDKIDNIPANDMEAMRCENEKTSQNHKQMHRSMKEVAEENVNDLQKIVNYAVDKIKSQLSSATKDWLRNHLSYYNISEISKIYNKLLVKIAEQARSSIYSTHWKELDSKIDSASRANCESYLQLVESRIKTFCISMKRKFELLDCFTEAELDEIGESEYQKVISDIRDDNTNISELISVGCGTLMKYFHEQNQQIIDHEETLAVRLIPEAEIFYNEEMTQFLSNVHSPNQLKEIHLRLTDKLLASFRMAFKLISRETICASVESKLEFLRKSLDGKFHQHEMSNMAKIKIIQEKITAIQRSAESSYQKRVDELMERNPNGLDVNELHHQHGDIVNEAKKLIAMDIRKTQ